MNSISKKLRLCIGCIILFGLLQVIYTNWVADAYGYEGYINSLELSRLFFAIIFLILLILFIDNNVLPSSVFCYVTVLVTFIPSMVVYVGGNSDFSYIFITFSAICIVILTSRFVKLQRIKFFKIKNLSMLNLLLIGAAVDISIILIFGGYKYLNFDFSKVYQLRDVAAAQLPSVFGYVDSVVGKVIIPFGVAFSFFERKWIKLILFLTCAILIFGLTQHKGPLFYPIFVLVIVYFAKKRRTQRNLTVLLIVLCLFVLASLMSSVYENGVSISNWFVSLFIDRALFIPAFLNSIFIDFFSDSQKYFWSTSKFTLGVLSPPYPLNASNLIGLLYFGSAETSANTGWIGSGFSEAGCFGVFLYSAFIGLWFSLLDAYAKRIPSHLVIGLFFTLVLTALMSANLTEMFLTHGLIIALLLLLVVEKPRYGVVHF